MLRRLALSYGGLVCLLPSNVVSNVGWPGLLYLQENFYHDCLKDTNQGFHDAGRLAYMAGIARMTRVATVWLTLL